MRAEERVEQEERGGRREQVICKTHGMDSLENKKRHENIHYVRYWGMKTLGRNDRSLSGNACSPDKSH